MENAKIGSVIRYVSPYDLGGMDDVLAEQFLELGQQYIVVDTIDVPFVDGGIGTVLHLNTQGGHSWGVTPKSRQYFELVSE